jgi:putative membrane protein
MRAIRTKSEVTDTEQMNGKIRMEGKLHPGNELAIARTVLANERTLMAILRTALGSFIGGASLLKFFGHPVYEIVGIILMIISAVILFVGIRKYRTIKKLIGAIDPEDWQALEAMVKKNRMANR